MNLSRALKATERSLQLAAIRTAVRIGAVVAPDRTTRAIAKRFFRTERPPVTRMQFGAPRPTTETMVVPDGVVTTYRWGERGQPTVLLVHGWSGWAQQMEAFVEPLRAQGLTVLAFDHVAHGASDGTETSLPAMIRTLERIFAERPEIDGVIAHSLGAAAVVSVLASTRRELAGAVAIAPPADPRPYLRTLSAMVGLPQRLQPAVEAAAVETTGVPFERLVVEPWLLRRVRTPLFVVHDLGDAEVPLANGYAYTTNGARMLVTDGLGHNRILRDRHVVQVATSFVVRRQPVPRVREVMPLAA
jgi:pimeloyl-ACP methyl ester carboxylesterase